MLNFTVARLMEQRLGQKTPGVILLITGDADFYNIARWCQSQGCVKLEVSRDAAGVSSLLPGLHASCMQAACLCGIHNIPTQDTHTQR